MITSLIDRYKYLTLKVRAPKVDPLLNHTYLQLHQAQRNRSFVEVGIEGDSEIYQSMVLDINPEERTLLVDELFPRGFLGLPGQQVNLSIRQSNGRILTFSSVIKEQRLYKGSPQYILEMPKDLGSDQRRSSYRLPLVSGIIDSRFNGPDQLPYHGRLCNVSSTGVAIEVAGESANSFHYNDPLNHVEFNFAGMNIDCQMAVRNVSEKPASYGERLLIGAEFVDLSMLEKKQLEKSIMRIQRDRLKFSGQPESGAVMAEVTGQIL